MIQSAEMFKLGSTSVLLSLVAAAVVANLAIAMQHTFCDNALLYSDDL